MVSSLELRHPKSQIARGGCGLLRRWERAVVMEQFQVRKPTPKGRGVDGVVAEVGEEGMRV